MTFILSLLLMLVGGFLVFGASLTYKQGGDGAVLMLMGLGLILLPVLLFLSL